MNLNIMAAAKAANGGLGGTIGLVIYIVIIGLVFYFLMIRPQKKKQKKEQAMRDSIQIGDELLTIGGYYVKVVSIKEDSFVVESTVDHTKMRIAKWAIQSNNTIHD